MTEQLPAPRLWATFEERSWSLLHHLEQIFDYLGSDRPEGDFRTVVVDRIHQTIDMNEHNLPEIIRSYLGQEATAKSADELMTIPIGGVVLPVTFCIRARIANENGDREQAWAYLAEACLLFGMMLAGKGLHGSYREAVAEAEEQGKVVFSNEGNKAKRAASNRFAEEAFRLARERKPAGAKWPKIIDAVLAIQADMLSFSRQEGIRAAPSNIQRRLSEVLSQMPGAAELFQSKG